MNSTSQDSGGFLASWKDAADNLNYRGGDEEAEKDLKNTYEVTSTGLGDGFDTGIRQNDAKDNCVLPFS